LSSAGKSTARFLLAGACVNLSVRKFVVCVALAGNRAFVYRVIQKPSHQPSILVKI